MLGKINKIELSSSDLRLFQEVLVDVKEQLDDHLTAINENTTEMQSNFEYMTSLNANLEKLAERIEGVELFLQTLGFQIKKDHGVIISQLTKKEQEVFLALYTLDESKGFVTYADISRKLCLTEEMVSEYISSLIAKSIPIHKRYTHNKAYIQLDPTFKTLQAKHNILNISQRIIPEIT